MKTTTFQNIVKTNLLTLVGLLLIVSVQVQAGEQLKAGDTLPKLNLFDQHEQSFELPSGTQRILLAADNTGSGMLTNFLDAQLPTWLAEHHTVYLADIHKMPSFVAKMFALPSLREKKYPIILGRDEIDLEMFPRQKGCVTLLPITDGKVADLSFICSEEKISSTLQ